MVSAMAWLTKSKLSSGRSDALRRGPSTSSIEERDGFGSNQAATTGDQDDVLHVRR